MKLWYALLIGTMVLAGGCVDFPTSYSRIEHDKVRVLDFIYEPAEAAPGDTVLCKAIFAGVQVNAQELAWRMSKKVVVNTYGITTAFDTIALDVTPVECEFSEKTSCCTFTFIVPDDILEGSPMIPDTWTDLLPDYYRSRLPTTLSAMSKTEVLSMLDTLSYEHGIAENEIDASIGASLPAVLQCFTVPLHLYCTVEQHTVVSAYSVRYNSKCAGLPGVRIPVNRNPRIDSIGVFAVQGKNLIAFNPKSGNHRFDYRTISCEHSATLNIDPQYTYFIGTFTGNIDTTVSIDAAMGNGTPLAEQYETQWYLAFDETEMDHVKPSELMEIEDVDVIDNIHIARLYPSTDHAITSCTAWIEVSDRFINEYYRPQGSTLMELQLQFTYKDN